MLLCFSVHNEKQLLSGCPTLFQNKLQEQGVQDVVNRNRTKFEPYRDLVDQNFSQFNENSINNQDLHSQTGNDEIPEQNIPMKMIQMIQKQTKLLQFLILCHKY